MAGSASNIEPDRNFPGSAANLLYMLHWQFAIVVRPLNKPFIEKLQKNYK